MNEVKTFDVSIEDKLAWFYCCERKFQKGEKAKKVIKLGKRRVYALYFCSFCYDEEFVKEVLRRCP